MLRITSLAILAGTFVLSGCLTEEDASYPWEGEWIGLTRQANPLVPAGDSLDVTFSMKLDDGGKAVTTVLTDIDGPAGPTPKLSVFVQEGKWALVGSDRLEIQGTSCLALDITRSPPALGAATCPPTDTLIVDIQDGKWPVGFLNVLATPPVRIEMEMTLK